MIAHKYRLARFGFGYLEHVADRAGCEIVVANQQSLSPERELTAGLLAIMHTFCCHRCGPRRNGSTLRAALAQDVAR
jgi:putative resolvase